MRQQQKGESAMRGYVKSNQNETDFQSFEKDLKPHMTVAGNGFVKIIFHIIFCHSRLPNMIRFQLDMYKNQIWIHSLNKA